MFSAFYELSFVETLRKFILLQGFRSCCNRFTWFFYKTKFILLLQRTYFNILFNCYAKSRATHLSTSCNKLVNFIELQEAC